MATDTWFTRDLPLLDAIVTYFDEHMGRMLPQLSDLSEITGLSDDDTQRAALALDGSYIELSKTMGPARHWHVSHVEPQARVAVGQWPSAESLAASILRGLEVVAEEEGDEDARGRIRSAIGTLGGAARDVSTNVLAAVIARQLGVG